MIAFAELYLFLFGALTIAGGVMGFLKARSLPSLIAGGISGLVLLGAGALTGGRMAQWGLILGALVSLALAGRFVPAFLRMRKFMPAGMMSILSVLGLFVSAATMALR